ncbi:hypothetical protein BDR04DRAFT_1117543 [Suillus decipiens]|nr:hypothetical protein BDR04DRAFT_1117543 [Suillus decipiens]
MSNLFRVGVLLYQLLPTAPHIKPAASHNFLLQHTMQDEQPILMSNDGTALQEEGMGLELAKFLDPAAFSTGLELHMSCVQAVEPQCQLHALRGQAKPIKFDEHRQGYTLEKWKTSFIRVWILPVQQPPVDKSVASKPMPPAMEAESMHTVLLG